MCLCVCVCVCVCVRVCVCVCKYGCGKVAALRNSKERHTRGGSDVPLAFGLVDGFVDSFVAGEFARSPRSELAASGELISSGTPLSCIGFVTRSLTAAISDCAKASHQSWQHNSCPAPLTPPCALRHFASSTAPH